MPAKQSSYQIHDVFAPLKPIPEIKGLVRVVDSLSLNEVIVIDVNPARQTVPYSIGYDRWIDILDGGEAEKVLDPYIHLPSAPTGLPPVATERLKDVIAATTTVSQNPSLLHRRTTLSGEIASVARNLKLSQRNVKRWILEWLQAGRNPAVVVKKFMDAEPRQLRGIQVAGKKRGVASTKPELASEAPAHEVADNVAKAYTSYIKSQGMPWKSAYYEMLIKLYEVPAGAITKDEDDEVLLTPALIEKYRLPTWHQFRYRCRRLQAKESKDLDGLPRGERGSATDNVPGPGFFEIDATHFQIQLVSRVTKSALVGRPSVYLIVDIYSDVITGYALTLENPSWAVAALALYNTFSDKGAIFERLGLPFVSADWPCRELPNMLRADRAELVSNMGQEFPASGVRVEVTPSMTPIAKGSVEGKNSETKHSHKSRFNLPGLFSKYRKRRESDGKRHAALDLLEFERILVEIIMDLNRRAVKASRLPPDALQETSRVASRVGFYEWALEARPGFTRTMGANFVYEHLLTKDRGTVTPGGIKFNGEVFNCDWLRANGYLTAALNGSYEIAVSYNPLFAGELFFFDRKRNSWPAASNVDPEILRIRASFPEAKEYRALQRKYAEQAGLNHHGQQRQRTPVVKQAIKEAVAEKNLLPVQPKGSKRQIRENRSAEKAKFRSAGLNGALPAQPPAPASPPSGAQAATPTLSSDGGAEPSTPNESTATATATAKFKSLWSKVNAVSK
ncbi:MAG: hypothetical protein WAQ05_07745 [Rubrivivax sp.]